MQPARVAVNLMNAMYANSKVTSPEIGNGGYAARDRDRNRPWLVTTSLHSVGSPRRTRYHNQIRHIGPDLSEILVDGHISMD
jgi:hypothetical protein